MIEKNLFVLISVILVLVQLSRANVNVWCENPDYSLAYPCVHGDCYPTSTTYYLGSKFEGGSSGVNRVYDCQYIYDKILLERVRLYYQDYAKRVKWCYDDVYVEMDFGPIYSP